jgi:DNA polymerase-3 subunit alpha
VQNKLPFDTLAPVFENAYVIYPLSAYDGHKLLENELIGITQYDVNRLALTKWKIPVDKVVILHTVTFRTKKDMNAQRLLKAIGDNTLLSMLDPQCQGGERDVMLSAKEFRQYYRNFPEVIKNTERVLDECTVEFNFNKETNQKNQNHFTGSAKEDSLLIRELCRKGLRYRYDVPSSEVMQRIDKELNMIEKKGFVSYFLMNWRIVTYALENEYFFVGRGSGANSIVAYLLRITDVDPIELDLYFERFINLYRTSAPDFDLDFSWRDREDVTRFIFNEFEHVSLLGTYNTFQQRGVLREIGKVFGLPQEEIKRIQDGRVSERQLDGLSRLVRQYSDVIKGLPNHMSVHAGGILISERSIHNDTATFMPPKGFRTTQFDMVTAEDIGLYKFDILGQRGLAKIKDCLTIVKQNRPDEPPIDIHDIPAFKEDERIKEQLRNGEAIGCFYVESPAMRMLLKKLRVDNYLGLVAASSVIRPGVASSGMMREYILRFRFPERRKDAHPVLLDIMPETFGVMVYQEDVIKVAHYYAGLNLGESDVLRRGMSGKFRSRDEFAKIEHKFFDNSAQMGRDPEVTKEVWRQIESFAGYAFSKGHSASYAVESYQTLFLKAHYPIEYMVATINNGGGFYRWDVYLHEARRHGADVEAPCINRSDAATVLHGKTIHIGLAVLRDLEHKTIKNVLIARIQDGDFKDMYDLVKRTAISLDQLSLLIRVGALRFTGKVKKELLWEAHFMLGTMKPAIPTPDLFDVEPRSFELPELSTEEYENAFDEMELLGLSLCSPFDLLKNKTVESIRTAQFKDHLNKVIRTRGFMTSVKYTRTTKGKTMYFGTFIDRNGDFLDTVHFPPVAAKYPFRGRGIYRMEGRVVEEFGFYSLEVMRMVKEPYIDDPRFVDIPLRAGEKSRNMKSGISQ